MSCTTPKERDFNDSKLMARKVYDAAKTGVYDNKIEIRNNGGYSGSERLYYKELRIKESFAFVTTLDFTLDPYITNYIPGDKIEVVIALLELTFKTFDGVGIGEYYKYNFTDTPIYASSMVIFNYKGEVHGYLNGFKLMFGVNNYNESFDWYYSPSDYNEEIHERYYAFNSNIFLTPEFIASTPIDYRTIGYASSYIEYLDGTINFKVTKVKHFPELLEEGSPSWGAPPKEVEICERKIIKEQIYQLSSDVVLSIITNNFTRYFEFEVEIILFNGKELYVEVRSDIFPALNKVVFRKIPIDKYGYQLTSDSGLVVGAKIRVYTYITHDDYNPTMIIVDKFTLL
jgi:hypothetical protein